MKILYCNGISERVTEVKDFYHDVAEMLAKEPIGSPIEITVKEMEHPENMVLYKISQRSGTRFIVELDNTMPKNAVRDNVKPVFLTCVKPENNAYKFYRLDRCGDQVKATYGRMGVAKGQLFGERSFMYPLTMYWPKYFEKLSKGYVDRSDLYLDQTDRLTHGHVSRPAVKLDGPAYELFSKLLRFAKHAVEQAQVNVPITSAIIKKTEELIDLMRDAHDVDRFNELLLELISILQRPVRTGDGSGVRELMARSSSDFSRIIQREGDLLQAMAGSVANKADGKIDSFDNYGIEVYEATEKQKQAVMRKLSDELKPKVHKIYRVIPKGQKRIFLEYLEKNNIKTVKHFWHGSRNQNWMSIVLNSLKLNPDAIITGKMFGQGIYFAPSSLKSWNYTSYNGTSWAHGMSDTAFMGLYATAYGIPKDVMDWSAYEDYKALVENAGANCLHAHKGQALRNDEIIYYDENAVLLDYIVEFR